MSRKCIICGETAIYLIKESTDAYCTECALDCFSDVSLLQKVEEQAQELKELIKSRIEEEIQETTSNGDENSE